MEAMDIKEGTPEKIKDRDPTPTDLLPVLQARGKERMEIILNSEHARELFQALPEEEAYFTIKEIGEQDAIPLLSLMSNEQCQYLLDLELWKGFEFNPDKVDHWLPFLLSCEEKTVSQWLRSINIDTLLLILKKNIRVHIKEDDESLSPKEGETMFFSLNENYSIEFLKPSLQNQMEQLLKSLAHVDLNFYWDLLNQVRDEIEAELEERTLHFKEARLEDKGFPPLEEALNVYQYLNPKRLKQMLQEKEIQFLDLNSKGIPPTFPLTLKDQGMLLSLCLKEMEQGPLLDRIKMELTYLTNQVLVVEQPETIDLPTLQGGLKKVGGYLSIGLELLSEGDLRKTREYLEQIPLKYLFQVGFGASLELKWRAERIWKKSWFSEQGLPLSFLGSPWEERLKGLLRKRPLFYSEEPEMGYREFRSLNEIRLIDRDLDRIDLLQKILSSLPPFTYSEELTWKTMLLSTLAHELAEPTLQYQPLSTEETLLRLEQLHQRKGDLKESFMGWFMERFNFLSEQDITTLNGLVTFLLEELHEAIEQTKVSSSCGKNDELT